MEKERETKKGCKHKGPQSLQGSIHTLADNTTTTAAALYLFSAFSGNSPTLTMGAISSKQNPSSYCQQKRPQYSSQHNPNKHHQSSLHHTNQQAPPHRPTPIQQSKFPAKSATQSTNANAEAKVSLTTSTLQADKQNANNQHYPGSQHYQMPPKQQ